MDEQRFAVPEAPTPGIHPAAERRDGCLRCGNVVLLAIVVGLVAAALVVMVILVMVASMATTLTWAHAGHGAQSAGQLPPRPAAGRLRPKVRSAIGTPCLETITQIST